MLERNERGLPKTGQTVEYTSGDDGTYEVGWNQPTRFVDNSDGTVTDHATGLMWVKEVPLIIPGAPNAAMLAINNQLQVAQGNWAVDTAYAVGDLIFDAVGGTKFYACAVAHTSDAVSLANDIANHPTYWRETVWTESAANLTTNATNKWVTLIPLVEALEYGGTDTAAGYTDWRVPNAVELFSLVDFSAAAAPCTYTSFFPNTTSFQYWASTAAGGATTSAWTVNFASVGTATHLGTAALKDHAIPQYIMRPVRGGVL